MRPKYSDLTEKQKEILCNGCGFCFFGKNNCLLEKLIPEFTWTDVCNEHDFYTRVGGYLTEYLGTQLVFFGKIVMQIADSSRSITIRLYQFIVAMFYFAFVFVFGALAFGWGKPKTVDQLIKKYGSRIV